MPVGLSWRAGRMLWTQGCLWQPHKTTSAGLCPQLGDVSQTLHGHLSPALCSAPTSVPPQPPALQSSGTPPFPPRPL